MDEQEDLKKVKDLAHLEGALGIAAMLYVLHWLAPTLAYEAIPLIKMVGFVGTIYFGCRYIVSAMLWVRERSDIRKLNKAKAAARKELGL